MGIEKVIPTLHSTPYPPTGEGGCPLPVVPHGLLLLTGSAGDPC